jgi:hypothetical protein
MAVDDASFHLQDEPKFAGAWRLVSWTSNTPMVAERFGRHPRGMALFDPQSHTVSVQIAGPGRLPFPPEQWTDPDEGAARAALQTYFAYVACYSVDAVLRVLVNDITESLIPNLVGTRQVRNYDFVGDRLVLTSPPIDIRGQAAVQTFVWERPT